MHHRHSTIPLRTGDKHHIVAMEYAFAATRGQVQRRAAKAEEVLRQPDARAVLALHEEFPPEQEKNRIAGDLPP